MTRQGSPSIFCSDLCDNATSERIDRIWDRIEGDLPVSEPVSGPSIRMMSSVFVAVAASLVGGLLLGKLIWDQPRLQDVSVAPTPTEGPVEVASVFAAGSLRRSYPLPGGGQIQLSPGSTVEVVNQQQDFLELRLVQGEAEIDTKGSPSQRLVALVAGDASLSTQGSGLVRVRRNELDLDVSVADGQVTVRSPEGEHRVAKGDPALAVSLQRLRSAERVAPLVPRTSIRVESTRESVAVVEAPVQHPSAPDWQTHSRSGDTQEALRLLRAQLGGIDAAISAAPDADCLWEIHDVAIGHDPAAAYRALTRVAEAFPGDVSAQLAAYKLGNYYRRAGQHELANKWFARTAERSEGILAEDALCKQFRTTPSAEEAHKLAQEYLSRYPDGRCKSEAERLLAGGPSDDDEDEEAVSDSPVEPPSKEAPH